MPGVGKPAPPRAGTEKAGEKGPAFWELFAGKGGVTKAVREALAGTGHQVWDPLDKHGARESWDLTEDDVFIETLEKIRKHRPMWIHMAPPCRTFTRARDGRRDGGPGRLRSDAKPEGWGPEAEEGNLLALRAEAFAEEQEKGGRLFTIEHPLHSYMWDLKPFKKRRKDGRGTLVALDQCAFGAPHQKPTGLLTNGECFHALAKRCREAPKHTHVPLRGKVWDEANKSEVWRTSLAAAYPEGMCRAMAEAFSRHLRAGRPAPEGTKETRRTGPPEGFENPSWNRLVRKGVA